MTWQNKSIKNSILTILFLIFIIAFLYRVINLGSDPPGLYIDELDFLLSAYAQLYNIGYLLVPGYNLSNFIFYTIDGYIPSIILFHVNPFSARFPVAFYGSLMVFPVYLVTYDLFKNEKIALISSFIWAISPSAVVTSRVGYGVEIFPLFLFLFFIYFWMKFLRYHQWKFLALSSIIFIVMFAFPPIEVWALIPTIGTIIYTIFPEIRKKAILRRFKNITYVEYIVAFFIAITTIWMGLLYAPYIYSFLSLSGALAGIPEGFLLVSRSFPYSVLDFFLRIGYALAPWKTFWLGEFSSTGLNYGPVFVPSMMIFLVPFFYVSVFGIPFFYRKNKKIMDTYYLLIGLMLFGLIQPVFNISNPYFNFEPSEGIFALPFYCMLSAFSFYLFLEWSFKTLKTNKIKTMGNAIKDFTLVKKGSSRRAIAAILIAVVVLLAGANIASFSSDLFVSSNEYYQNSNTSMNYIFYGWNHVADYLVNNHLCNETLYYTPGRGGVSFNLTNPNNFNFWFYHQNFPLYWLYTYSSGKIIKLQPLYPGSVPPVPSNSSIVLSQNASYPQLLSANGINNRILYTVYRSDGKPAIEVIQVKDAINASEKKAILVSNLFYDTNINKFQQFNISSLSGLSTQITVSVKFSVPYGSLKSGEGYNLISSVSPTFSLGVWPRNIFIHGSSNASFVPIGAIYSDFGNYSAPNTWQRLYDYAPLAYNTTYMLTLKFYNHREYLYVNDTLVGTYLIEYPLAPVSPPIIYVDYNINATIYNLNIWDIGLNVGEIGYIYYNSAQ